MARPKPIMDWTYAEYVTDAIRRCLTDTYVLRNGRQVTGQSVSCLCDWLRHHHNVRVPSRTDKLESWLDSFGYVVTDGKNTRGRWCQVVVARTS